MTDQYRPLPALHTYQKVDVRRQLTTKSICNNLPLGAGKTWVNLAYIQGMIDLKQADVGIVVTKKSTITTAWARTIERHFPWLTYKMCHGDIARDKREDAWRQRPLPDLFICNYETLINRMDSAYMMALAREKRVVLVADEAHYLRNVDTKRHQAWIDLADRAVGIVPTTATPVQTSPLDFYGMLSAMRYPNLQSQRAWMLEWCNCKTIRVPAPMARRGYHEVLIPIDFKKSKHDALRTLLQRFFIRRSPDLITLPPLRSEDRLVSLTSRERAAYSAAEAELSECLKTAKNQNATDYAIRKALQEFLNFNSELRAICSGKRAAPGELPSKDAELIHMLPELTADGNKTVVYSPYAQTVHRLIANCKHAYPEWDFVHIIGDDSALRRGQAVRDLVSKDNVKVLFMTDAGAEGVDGLQEKASRLVMFDQIYNPAQEDQITGRVYRQGQTKEVIKIRFIAEGTIEEKIDEKVLARRDVMAVVDHLSRTELTDFAKGLLSGARPRKKVGG